MFHEQTKEVTTMAVAKRANRTANDAKAHVKNAATTSKGKVKAAVGKATGNRKLQAKGKLEEVKGKTKQAGQRVKESLERD
jgi:uncharacterized protein YjbJ (UPF0337 family)